MNLVKLMRKEMPDIIKLKARRLSSCPSIKPDEGLSALKSPIAREWTSNKIRSTFVDYFVRERDHQFVRSSSVLPDNDSTLLLVNSGMNQFKPIFLDSLPPDDERRNLRRAANSQKCIRVGGKHNDLDAVGKDMRHHTFFEMLGNWSFGDYYKKEACSWAWDLLTNVYKLDKNRLVVTYHAGDQKYNLQADEETKDIWLSIGIKPDRLIPLGSSDNFWEMSSTGPCGPCTEIHYVLGDQRTFASPQEMLDDSIEIWNLVFIQFNKDSSGALTVLPKKHVDTGMGLERIVSIIQTEKKNSNYDSDLFVPLFDYIQKSCKACPPYQGSLSDPFDISYRIIADHCRMFSIAVADGLIPGKENANHKLRKVIRAANWELMNRFNQKSARKILVGLSHVVAVTLGDAYPELRERQSFIDDTLSEQVVMFEKLVGKTRSNFGKKAKELVNDGKQSMSGKDAFHFYKTFGSPKDLLSSLAEKYGLVIDFEEFDSIHRNEVRSSVEKGGKVIKD